MSIAVFAGSFDPPSLGHLDIIKRACNIFSHLHVVIATNSEKRHLFSSEERLVLFKEILKDIRNVTVVTCDTLIVEYATKVGATTLVRGLRNIEDFSYEFDISVLNKKLCSSIETIFLPTDPKYFAISSTAIKEFAKYNQDLSTLVPEPVIKALREKTK